MTFALVYARASSDPSDQRISVDRQVKLCTARAADLWPAAQVRVFRDDGITATHPNVHRPGFADFLTAVRTARKGELVGVVVNEQSRLTRQGTGAWDELVVTLTKAGLGKVETLRSGPISVEPGNRLVGRMLAVVDAEEVERTKSRVQAAHRELFDEGRPSGRAPFGYRSTRTCPGPPQCQDHDDGRPHLEPDPVEAPVVVQVFEWALQGHAISSIITMLNAGSVKPRSASWKFKNDRQVTGWTANSVRSLLTSPSVVGLRAHTDADGQLHTVVARWPALIDVDEWRRVQRMLCQPTEVLGTDGEKYWVRTKPKPQPRKYLLSGGRRRGLDGKGSGEVYGVLRCGKCDLPLVAQPQGRPGGRTIPAYACHPKLDPEACGGVSISPADEVEALVVDAIKARLVASSKLRQRLSATENAEADRWRAERDAAKARMLRAAEMLGAGKIDPDEWTVMHAPAKGAYDSAQSRLDSMATDTVLPSVEDVIHRWEDLTLVQQRAVVERLIKCVVIAPGQTGTGGLNRARVGKPKWLA